LVHRNATRRRSATVELTGVDMASAAEPYTVSTQADGQHRRYLRPPDLRRPVALLIRHATWET
jgi:hypothetical protein